MNDAEATLEEGVSPAPEAESDAALETTISRSVAEREASGEPIPHRPMPKTVGRFEIVRELGAGGMGVVYEAYDARLDRRVAVKLVLAEAARERARLMREAQAMARIQHPNVVAVHEVGVEGDDVFVAMERVEGQTLTAWLSTEPRSWRAVVGMFVDAGRGLAAAHAAGVVHRDFKPDNVLVDRDGRARVLDFGLARANDEATPEAASPSPLAVRALSIELTRGDVMMGTPSYMSPEHFRGRDVGPKSDQFGFAVGLYRALFHTPPFLGRDVAALRSAVLAGALQEAPPTDVPAAISAAVTRALSHDPAERFASMEELVDTIEAPLRVDPDHDPSTSRAGFRRGAVAMLGVHALVLTLQRVYFGSIDPSPAMALRLAYLGAIAMGVASIVMRKHLFQTRHTRRVSALFALAWTGLLIHRLLVIPMGVPVREAFIGDALIVAGVMSVGAVTVERWFAIPACIGVATSMTLALVPSVGTWPAAFMMAGTMASGVWFWGRAGVSTAPSSYPTRRSISSSRATPRS